MYLTDKQVADFFGVHRSTVWRWEAGNADGFPKSVALSPGCRRWRREEVEAWAASRTA
ncbi:helix-turn-helix transcriptional regulator [Pseudooceanicola nitratireducens]|jgi:predicted DNA-binding transcriptional regulator AlpA|uniref:helix-turn-helix transcriptional regulator n=1 Tax=Pseudooceanicola nitratireducens TaxID=517719 RepID=UPI001C981624|nr:AlpA family phage regulatory protein [Pseudooceanicola nitratireducens]